jgi:hypothetical protein
VRGSCSLTTGKASIFCFGSIRETWFSGDVTCSWIHFRRVIIFGRPFSIEQAPHLSIRGAKFSRFEISILFWIVGCAGFLIFNNSDFKYPQVSQAGQFLVPLIDTPLHDPKLF